MKYLQDKLHIILLALIIIGVLAVLYYLGRLYPASGNNLADLYVFVGLVILIIFVYENIKNNGTHNRKTSMTREEAEKIIHLYGKAIAKNPNPIKYLSTLPYSKGKIRYAYFAFIACYIDDYGRLPDEVLENIVAKYSMLDTFLPDEEAKKIDQRSELIKNHKLDKHNPEDKILIDEYFSKITNGLCNMNYREELREFINQCYAEKNI